MSTAYSSHVGVSIKLTLGRQLSTLKLIVDLLHDCIVRRYGASIREARKVICKARVTIFSARTSSFGSGLINALYKYGGSMDLGNTSLAWELKVSLLSDFFIDCVYYFVLVLTSTCLCYDFLILQGEQPTSPPSPPNYPPKSTQTSPSHSHTPSNTSSPPPHPAPP